MTLLAFGFNLMARETEQRIAHLICLAVVAATVTGYFIGMKSPMNPALQDNVFSDVEKLSLPTNTIDHGPVVVGNQGDRVVPATAYSEMGKRARQIAIDWKSNLSDLKSNNEGLAEIVTTAEQKTIALAKRSQNRAYNGAPPTIPHPISEMTVEACVLCHTDGTKTASLRIPKMSHQFLANCTQCHVESVPQHLKASLFRENTFVGIPAPTKGDRAYKGAPPTIPHSTWMRSDCMSCHGYAGLHGIRSTHPWRKNCQQCHAPSAQLDQVPFGTSPSQFLPPPVVEKSSEN